MVLDTAKYSYGLLPICSDAFGRVTDLDSNPFATVRHRLAILKGTTIFRKLFNSFPAALSSLPIRFGITDGSSS